MRLVSVALALAALSLTLTSCDLSPTATRIEHPAQVAAVTVPENLVAGSEVYVYFYWFQEDCGDVVGPFHARQDGPRSWTVEAIASHEANAGIICYDSITCFPYIDSLRVRVPSSGVDHYRLSGELGAVPFDIAPGSAVGPEHRITVVHAADGTPYANLVVDYWAGRTAVVDSTRTDSSGTAVFAPPPCDGTILSLQDRDFPCGYGALNVTPYFLPLCGRSFHTIALYDAVWSPSTSAMYSAGNR